MRNYNFNDELAMEQFLIKNLPSGSGIDCDYQIDYKSGKVKIKNSWHAMDEFGQYIGFIDFTISFNIEEFGGFCGKEINFTDNDLKEFKLTFQTNSKGYRFINYYDLRSYLDDLFFNCFDSEFPIADIKRSY